MDGCLEGLAATVAGYVAKSTIGTTWTVPVFGAVLDSVIFPATEAFLSLCWALKILVTEPLALETLCNCGVSYKVDYLK